VDHGRISDLTTTTTATTTTTTSRIRILDNLITKEIPQNLRDINIAKEQGDLRENAGFKAAKEHQRVLAVTGMTVTPRNMLALHDRVSNLQAHVSHLERQITQRRAAADAASAIAGDIDSSLTRVVDATEAAARDAQREDVGDAGLPAPRERAGELRPQRRESHRERSTRAQRGGEKGPAKGDGRILIGI
jgi:hypothetical protein